MPDFAYLPEIQMMPPPHPPAIQRPIRIPQLKWCRVPIKTEEEEEFIMITLMDTVVVAEGAPVFRTSPHENQTPQFTPWHPVPAPPMEGLEGGRCKGFKQSYQWTPR